MPFEVHDVLIREFFPGGNNKKKYHSLRETVIAASSNDT